MLAAVAVVESFVARHPLDYSDPVSLSWRLAARAARREAPGCRVVGGGDSLVKHAAIPAVIEARTGARTINLAVARAQAPATYFLIRRALEAGARPEALVIDFKPALLLHDPRKNVRYWQEIATPREILDLAWATARPSFGLEIACGRLLPTLRARLEVRGHLRAALRDEPSPLRLINRICRRNWRVNRGANVATPNPGFTGTPSPGERPPYSHLWYCHRVNAAYIARLLDLADARGVRVYWLLPPISPWLQGRREASGAEAGYLRFVRGWQARHPRLTVVDGRHSGYDHTTFVDTTHLDFRGAAALSSDLAAILVRDRNPAAAQGPGRWIDLPPYRPLAPDVPLEDVGRSRMALGNATRATRLR